MNTNQEIALAIVAAFFGVGVLTLIGAYLIIGIGWQEFDTTHGDMRTHARPSGLVLTRPDMARPGEEMSHLRPAAVSSSRTSR
jgi:hypothetical protein